MDAPLPQDFLAQAEELIDSLFADISELRRAASLTGQKRRALVDQTFRHAHTLKGSAATLPRLEAASHLAHELENLLDAVRASRLAADDAVLDACEDATEALSRLVEAAARGVEAPATSDVVARLRQLIDHRADVSAEADGSTADDSSADALASLPAEVAALLSARERQRLGEAITEGARAALIEVAFDLSDFDEKFNQLTDALRDSVEIVATLPGSETVEPARISLRLLGAASASPEELATLLAPFAARVVALSSGADAPMRDAIQTEAAATNAAVTGSSAAESDAATATDDESRGAWEEREAAGAQSLPSATPASVRVPLEELDELVFAANELFDDAVRALDVARTSSAKEGAARIDEVAPRLQQNFHALVERVMALRMRTLARMFERAARAARVAARRAGKRVEIEIEGGEARVERSAVDRLAEPLAHLLRNAVDHGIESPKERRAAGKPERGRVRIEARVEGSRVRVSVADDGRGIDAARVEGAARAQGLIGEGSGVSEAQALRLIFRPGFSTVASVSMSSGRGVGLDAVEHEIEQAGGEVRVRTRAGVGTTFELNLPLAIALVPAVLVEACGFPYALDASRVVETIPPEDLKVSDDADARTVRWREQHLPLVNLGDLLGQASTPSRGEGERVEVAIVRADDARNNDAQDAEAGVDGEGSTRLIALTLGRVTGRRDVLVRSLGRHATHWRGVSGAIDLRDGTVALMLDLPRLLGN
ncbi:MAG: two-component system, chemotaxis family, sensor kinase CheA [Acidobacteriota bacterium]|nr:two-component system, chemotaxis family, sensor kinase CheA [Acidobacteriota bacterium]